MSEEPEITTDIELINDGDGVAVVGEPTAVVRFLSSHGLDSRDLGLQRLGSSLHRGATVAQAGADIASSSGRWIKLTKESAQALDKYTPMRGSHAGVSRAVVTDNGKIKSLVEYIPGAGTPSPAVLTGIAGLMTQVAMQQTMDQITNYLATIDRKLDDVLRAQEDAVWADLIGVGLDIDEAMTIREHVGRVNEVTWSKVQAATSTVSRTQVYALRQIDAYADKLEKESGISDLADIAREVETKVQGWLVVIARTIQLHEAIGVLELDRVFDSEPEDLDAHRTGLTSAREKRVEAVADVTARLLDRMRSAAREANSKVLFNPSSSPAVVRSNNAVADVVGTFRDWIGIDHDGKSLKSREWSDAATEVRDKALEIGADTVGAAVRIGGETLDQAKNISGKVGGKLAEGVKWLRRG